jgi:hypothetical protein
MAFLRWFGFENVNFKITTERLGIALFCAFLTIGSTFTPIINTPHVLLGNIPSDMGPSRLAILVLEVFGIGCNLVQLRGWAAGFLVYTFYELFENLKFALAFTQSINNDWAKDPTIHFTQLSGLGWGWWFIILGPCIMAAVLIRDSLHDWRKKRL